MSDEIRILLGTITGAVIALIAIPPIVRVARIKELVDKPNGRTSHTGLVPSLGGVAVFAAVVIGSSLFMPQEGLHEMRYILAAMIMVFFIGMKDDLVNLGFKKKLIVEFVAAALVVILANVRIGTLHGMFGVGILPYWISLVLSVIVIVGLVNCYNLIDGIDGLASGLGIVTSVIFGIFLLRLGSSIYALIAFTLAGSLGTFYVFNVFGKKYKLFLGDTGSLLLGFLMAIFALKILCCRTFPGDVNYMRSLPTVVIGLMIIPIVDTLRVFAVRIYRGKSPFCADKMHLHHQFLAMGFPHWKASAIIIGLNTGLFCLALLMKDLHPVASVFILFTAAFIVNIIPVIVADKLRQKSRRAESDLRMNRISLR
jgi:UDP-N-acetylmuramyl pentapeptide phosphotransferase/UDP-N-acetylglucosamine-1-phosphate transferase